MRPPSLPTETALRRRIAGAKGRVSGFGFRVLGFRVLRFRVWGLVLALRV